MITIKLATPQDTGILADIQIASWRSAFKDILTVQCLEKYTNYERVKGILDHVVNDQIGLLYVGYLDDKPCAELFWCNDNKGNAEIVAVHSTPESWGSGLGKAMMTKALEDISNQGHKSVYLWVFSKNNRAKRFYEKCGFTQNGEEKTSDFDNEIEMKYMIQL